MKTLIAEGNAGGRKLPRVGAMVILLGVIAVAVGLSVLLYLREASQAERALRDREYLRVAALGRQFSQDLNSLVSLTGVLAENTALRNFLTDGRPEALENFGRDALAVSRSFGDLDQIRYLDERGNERVRVNSANGLVPAAQLQNKSDRPYFREAIRLSAGERYLSAFDLNVEQGIVERPFKPMLRVSCPLFDASGRVRGVVVTNIFGQRLLDRMVQTLASYRTRVRMLNDRGFWLRGASPDEEWGFMLSERGDITLARSAAELWQEVIAHEGGQVRWAGGLFTWQRFSPQTIAAKSGGQIVSGDAFWILVSQMSAEEWSSTFRPLRQTFFLIGFVLLGLSLGAFWLFGRERNERGRRRETDELNAAILRSAGAGVVTLSPDGMVRSINSTAERMLGWQAEEVIARQNGAIFYDRAEMKAFARETSTALGQKFRHGLQALAAKVDRAESAFEREWTCVRKDGTRFPALIANSVIRDARGKPFRYLAVFSDISKRKEVEEALRAARTAAEESTQLKARFLANMSHEIRTPMNGVVGMIGLLFDTDLTPEQRMLADTARVSADSLLTIINDILDFSKIEAGQLSFSAAPFDLRDPVENCLSLLAEKAHAKGIELAYLIDEDVPTQLIGDAGRLQQVLINFVGNAVKFTEQGEVIVSISKLGEIERQVRLRLAVRDTGIGIAPAVQAKLFQPFVQANSGITSKFGGTGLGLAISKQLVALMGGQVGLESVEGRGSTFWFTVTLPLQAAIPKVVPPRVNLAGRRALVVDDNATNREVIARQLASWRIKAVITQGAEAALAAVREAAAAGESFDFGIVDMHMPDTDGLQLAALLHHEPSSANLRLILLSSLGEIPAKQELAARGIAAALTKPLRQAQLLETLQRVLSNGRSRSPFPGARTPSTAPLTPPTADENLRILLAEDNPVNQHVARLQLQKLGYRPKIVATGREALAAIQSETFDLVLMDCQMPEIDGLEATRLIRAGEAERRARGEQFTALPIIAMTANAMAGDREACLAAGMTDYVSKPVRSDDLAAAIAKVILK
jgi:PAS domain S-box-containing protein